MNVTAQLLNDTLDNPRYSDASYSDWEVWMKDAVLVLLSLSEHPMTEEGCRTLVRCTSSPEDRQSVIHQLLEQIAGYEGYRRVFERLHSASSPLMLFRLEETTSGGEFGWWGLSLSDLIGEFKHFQTLQIQLEQDNVSIVAAAGKCLDLLGSQPDRSAIETFVKKTSRHWQEYEFKDLIRALKAFIPKDKVSRYPILDTLQ
ncbi:hypothetical protein PHLCEN_2v10868 [Hermanssonia centrifuga]|uniref:Uncharacterized protein n=1 Tax=Hermanssonia centrifuga TaxID=98765 RepID=A0A2R6NLI9_9APHY|nr:hypothetical protein PHLCEN_2v10868 [Hermanssonia centrifuga]